MVPLGKKKATSYRCWRLIELVLLFIKMGDFAIQVEKNVPCRAWKVLVQHRTKGKYKRNVLVLTEIYSLRSTLCKDSKALLLKFWETPFFRRRLHFDYLWQLIDLMSIIILDLRSHQHFLGLQHPWYKEQLEKCLVFSPVLCGVEQMVCQ